MIRSEHTITATEQAAEQQRTEALKAEGEARDLTASRAVMVREAAEVDRMADWWETRYPGSDAHKGITMWQHWAAGKLAEVDDKISAVTSRQQAHKQAADELAELARLARLEWQAEHPADAFVGAIEAGAAAAVARTVPDAPGPARTDSGRLVATGVQDTREVPAPADETRDDVRHERDKGDDQ